LITARLAADQGREVFAVPGSIFSPLSRGSHLLLKEGARPVEDAEDVLNALEVFRDLLRRLPAAPPAGAQAPSPNLAPDEEALLSRISLDPLGVDDLAAGSRLAAGPLAAALLNLELKGLVRSLPGKTYVRAEAALKG
jgi:DNA processing protein